MITTLSDWLSQNSLLLGLLAAGSTILLLASIVATPWLVAQLPDDYLLQLKSRQHRHPVVRMCVDIIRTLLGFTLIVFGLVMLVIPGPGLITLLMGISIARFPGKRRLLRYIASRESVFNSLNWMRRRHGKPALLHPRQGCQE
ncbi:MAG: PGPGW domain-containing protein [Granulosicoccus sp.]